MQDEGFRKRVAVELTPDELALLDRIRTRLGESRTGAIRELILAQEPGEGSESALPRLRGEIGRIADPSHGARAGASGASVEDAPHWEADDFTQEEP